MIFHNTGGQIITICSFPTTPQRKEKNLDIIDRLFFRSPKFHDFWNFLYKITNLENTKTILKWILYIAAAAHVFGFLYPSLFRWALLLLVFWGLLSILMHDRIWHRMYPMTCVWYLERDLRMWQMGAKGTEKVLNYLAFTLNFNERVGRAGPTPKWVKKYVRDLLKKTGFLKEVTVPTLLEKLGEDQLG